MERIHVYYRTYVECSVYIWLYHIIDTYTASIMYAWMAYSGNVDRYMYEARGNGMMHVTSDIAGIRASSCDLIGRVT